ncbi:ferrous iron transport protein A [Slackia heliotrinireducens]|uniref:Uncharacterized protein n=1 Tax=Slackia heliotrinireducens (strain ATCC 29202 / DSM 20476 / NCTC 11029 / RHS 1) TaxID=471855 RepID=C7N7W4_SLAHD|nr:ferrous iron transport protein A [Slackia heliotrinireducens]ACV22999.1 hypothetical protein Shel_19850 [Slackia heliotrinireducens DSM 20476]VEH01891.1 Uncharacterised protein [Slackia heliotrinireducens]
MITLNQAQTGRSYRIAWLLGSVGQALEENLGMRPDDRLDVKQNSWVGSVVDYNGKLIAMSHEAAHYVKLVS